MVEEDELKAVGVLVGVRVECCDDDALDDELGDVDWLAVMN